MKRRNAASIVLTVVVVGCILFFRKESSRMTDDYAVQLIKNTYPEYKEYPSDTLPPKRIEVITTRDGWRVGMYVEGSGVKGILKAHCFLVTNDGTVSETGLFQGEGPANAIDLSTCVPKE
jgi:hypothetical protein